MRHSPEDTARALQLLAESRADDYVKGYEDVPMTPKRWPIVVAWICIITVWAWAAYEVWRAR